MSAVSSSTSDREGDAVRRAYRASEPSMEEILASIRTIIADDRENAKSSGKLGGKGAPTQSGPQIVYSKDSPSAASPSEPTGRIDEAEQSKVIRSQPPVELPAGGTDSEIIAGGARASLVESEAGKPPILRGKLAAEALEHAANPSSPVDTSGESAFPSLLSPEADSAVTFAFSDLSATLARRAEEVADARILEMLRPLLKDWLDKNMPAIVEKLVRGEIERIVRAPR
jgi:uncharacterized protein